MIPRRTVLSLEQALSMSYATLRMVHLGWRVIRVEAAPVANRASRGDPNRYIGRPVAGEDRHSYFVAPNAGKESLVLDLKKPEGRALLHRLIRELPVDVFCTNTLPARLESLGADYETLRKVRESLVWCSISALGPEHPDTPGYDPMLQALCGYMDLTGQPDGPPTQCGPPIIDLKAGDEAFVQVLLALLAGTPARIDISMAQVAVSWLHTFLPMLDMGSPPEEIRRSGNEHRQFVPTNAYPTRDGHVYVTIGSDAQWARLVRQPPFAHLDDPRYATNEGRRRHRKELHEAIAAATGERTSAEVAATLKAANIPHAPITPIEGVLDLPFLKPRFLRTRTPDGRTVRLPPPAVDLATLDERGRELPFAPGYGEHTEAILGELGMPPQAIAALRASGVVA
ncbi:MAG: CaiB/BaiF CoA-transferase family protein [Planctomycetota bacterium]